MHASKRPKVLTRHVGTRLTPEESAAAINDQELAIIAEISGKNDAALTRRRNLRIWPGNERYALFRAPGLIRGAKIQQFCS